jgi:hypothetical protein
MISCCSCCAELKWNASDRQCDEGETPQEASTSKYFMEEMKPLTDMFESKFLIIIINA